MLRWLARLGATAAAQRFMQDVLVADYDGSENAALADAGHVLLAAPSFDKFLGTLLETAFLRCPRALCELLFVLDAANFSQSHPDHGTALRRFAETRVGAPPGLASRPSRREFEGGLLQDEVAANAQSCYCLLFVLERLVKATARLGVLRHHLAAASLRPGARHHSQGAGTPAQGHFRPARPFRRV